MALLLDVRHLTVEFPIQNQMARLSSPLENRIGPADAPLEVRRGPGTLDSPSRLKEPGRITSPPTVAAVRGLSFSIAPGEVLGLVG